MNNNYDFSGWASKNDLLCSDGRIIRKGAFAECDGLKVPLVWNHRHNEPENVLGHAILENRPEGVYAYGYFNDTPSGDYAKQQVLHGDIDKLSIWANKLKQNGSDVLHGVIREVSLVLAGANPGAFIDTVLEHGEYGDPLTDEGIIFTDEPIVIRETKNVEENREEEMQHSDEKMATPSAPEKEKTVNDVLNELTEEQRQVVYALIGMALSEKQPEMRQSEMYDEEGGFDEMKHNVFDTDDRQENEVISHAEMNEIFADAKRLGSLKDSVLEHGITNIDYLFPDNKSVSNAPDFIKRDDAWVSKVMNGVHHTPFSRIKTMFANITADEARARGYVKGNLKVEEVFTLLKRSTDPQTVYKKQKLDRDDVIDITDFDVVGWMKSEMRGMLDEELARAFLVGDGRSPASDDKIKEDHIRPIWTDADLYTIKAPVEVAAAATDAQKAKEFIRTAIKARKNYKGSGQPTLFTTEDVLTDCLLIEDTTGRVIYDTEEKLRTALRVKEIVTVPVMENLSRTVDGESRGLMGIIVNMNDYNVGADRGGAVNMFDDFDIDYNQQKYLIETRCSGALVKPYSAIALELSFQ